MKKLNIFLISLLLMAFYSCSKEKEINRLSKTDNYGVAFSIEGLSSNATRATASLPEGTMAALDREKTITKLYAVVYQGGAFDGVKQATLESGSTYKFDMQKAGTFDVYLVANPDANLLTQLNTKANTPGSLKNLLVDQEVGADNQAKNFLMTAEPFNVTTEATKTVTHATAVSLVRLAARVDFYNTVEDLSMTKITFKNRVTNSILIDSKTHNKGLALNSTKTYQAAEGLKANECIGAIYSYENNVKGNVSFTLDATYKGASIKKDITFDNLPLKRNYLYHVIISEAVAGGGTPENPKPDPNNLRVNIVVADWNTAGVLEWKGDKLIGGIPTFTATGTNVTTTPSGSPAQNPTQVNVPTTHTTVTITTLGDVTYPVLEEVDVLPGDITINKGADSKVNGKFQRVYTISVGVNANSKPMRTLKFAVLNPLDKDKKQEFTLKQLGSRPKMAIEYVAEYNVNAAGDGFTNSHANDQSGYFNWYKATGTTDATYNTTGENIFGAAGLNGYHLPSKEEWHGIVSEYTGSNIQFTTTSSTDDYYESISINGVTKTYTADYRNTGNKVSYALRFKGNGNTQLSAWRYEHVGDLVSNNLNSQLKITVRYLGPDFSGSVADIDDEDYWNNNNGDDVTRVFPMAGRKDISGSLVIRGTSSFCWSSTQQSSSNAWCIYVIKASTSMNFTDKGVQLSVRPFSDN